VVFEEWPPTKSVQVGGADHRHNQPAANRHHVFIVRDSRWIRSVANEMKVLGVVLDRRLSFDRHATSVARACNYHVRAIRHILHLLTTELALTLACSLMLSRLDYCNAVLHGAPANSIQKLQCM